MAPEPLVSPVMGGRRRLDDFRLSDSFLTKLKKNLLLANEDMDNKIPPSYSLEENWAVQRNYPFITKPRKKELEVVRELFDLPEEEETKLYSKCPDKIQLSSSLDVPLHCKTVNFKRGFNAMDMLLIEDHNFVSIFNETILEVHPKIVSVPWFVGKGRPLKSSYNTEHGHAETIMHALGVQRALMLSDGTGSSSPNAAMVDLWLDSGASCHVIGNEEILSNRYDPPAGGRLLKVADGFEHKVESIGTIDTLGFRIPNVRFIRRFENLISVGQLAEDHNICSYLDKTSCVLILWVGQEGTLVGEGIKDKRNGLYRLTFLLVP